MKFLLRLLGIYTLDSILAQFTTAMSDLAKHEADKLRQAEKSAAVIAKHSVIAEDAKLVAAKCVEIRTNIEKLLGK